MITISRLYDTYSEADQAVDALERAGLPRSEISIFASNTEGWYSKRDEVSNTRTGADAGAVVGGALGLLAGIGLLAIPGIGPWTQQYIAMRGLCDPDAFLPSDLGVRRALEALGVPWRGPREVALLAEPWRPWRAYALMHLWRALAAPARAAGASADPADPAPSVR